MEDLKNQQFIIDTDPGIDDAIAITMALTNEALDVKLLSTVAGNVDVNKTTQNALKLVSFLKSDVPVVKGSAEPLLRSLAKAPEVHGQSGMDGYDFSPYDRQALPVNGIEKMKEVILTGEKQTTIIALGPLTNIALLLKTYPEVKDRISRIIFMGGSFVGGNISSAAEFNIYNDPHALEILINANLETVMVGLDVTNRALVTHAQMDQIKTYGDLGHMIYSLFKHYRRGSLESELNIHDATTIAYLLEPSMFKVEERQVKTVLEGPAVGATVINESLYHNRIVNKLQVCTDIDTNAYSKWFVKEIKRASETFNL